jgi:hypothetical protein
MLRPRDRVTQGKGQGRLITLSGSSRNETGNTLEAAVMIRTTRLEHV